MESGAPDLIPLLPPLRYFGDYELLAEIARGGMGVVYRARQVTLDRMVAVKMMRPGLLATAEEIRRFRTEATAAGGLQHPNIVAIHEIGEQDGLHYYSMDLVEGRSLAEMVRSHALEQRQAAGTVATLAKAVGYAHERGTLHRDLKPSNILVDDAGQPHITDFGLASSLVSEHRHTVTGSVIGTPAYMSPEQAGGHTKELTPASDVYSLGAILYELLTGRPPFQGAGVIETIQMARETAPVSPRVLNAKIDRDIETVVLKCLEKDPGRRYSTAADLAADLGRYLRREPVRARRIGRVARGWNWSRRHPWQTAAAAAIVLVAGVSAGSALLFRERLFDSYLQQAKLQRISHLDAGSLLVQAARIHITPELREEALQWSVTPRLTKRFEIPFGNVEEYRFSLDCQRLAIEGRFHPAGSNRWPEKSTKVWFLEKQQFLDSGAGERENFVSNTLEPPPDGLNVEKGAHLVTKGGMFSPDRRMFAATVVQGLGYSVVVWDLYRGEAIASLTGNLRPAWSPDGKNLVTLGSASLTARWMFFNDTRYDAGTNMGDAVVRIWQVDGPPAVEHMPQPVHSISFRQEAGHELKSLYSKEMAVNGVRWSFLTGNGGFPGLTRMPDDPPIGTDGVYDRSGRLVDVARRPGEAGWAMANTVAVWAMSGPAANDHVSGRPLSLSPGAPEGAGFFGPRQQAGVEEVFVSPSGEHALIRSRILTKTPQGGYAADGRSLMELWNLESGDRVASLRAPRIDRWFAVAAAFSPDGGLVAVHGRNAHVPEPMYLWESATGRLKGSFPRKNPPEGTMIFSPDGKTIYDAARDFTAYDVAGLREWRTWKGTGTRVRCLAVSTDGQVLLSGGEDGFIRLWRTSNGESLGGWEAQKAAVTALAFSLKGDVLASGGNDGSIRLWNFPSMRKELAELGLGF